MSGYDYGNARVRAMRSRLLTAAELDGLAEKRSLDGLLAALVRTPYRRAVETAIVRRTDVTAVHAAARLDVVSTLGRIPEFYTGRARQEIMLVLARADVDNLKAILRGLAARRPYEDIAAALLPVGELSAPVLDSLIRSGDPREVADRLLSAGHDVGRGLLEVRARRPAAAPPELELELDRWYFAGALEAAAGLSPVVMTALKLEADLVNILTTLRFFAVPGDGPRLPEWLGDAGPARLFVGPGHVATAQFVEASGRDTLGAALEGLSVPLFSDALRAGLARYARTRRLSDVERALLWWRLRWYRGLVLQDPLGAGVPLAYIALKTNEIANLRWIADGISLGLPPDAIREELEPVA